MREGAEHAKARDHVAAPLSAQRVLARLLLCFLLALGACPPGLAVEPQDEATAVGVQAAFLFKFGSYVDWPAGTFPTPQAPFRIATVGANELADALREVTAGRNVLGRPVTIESLEPGAALDDFHVVFIGDADDLRDAVAALEGRPALVVTQADAALASGSMINFVVSEGKLRFDVSLAAVEAAGLKLSSRLLAVARRIAGADGAG